MKNKIRYYNLTNGIEGVSFRSDIHFIRIQSTACEQKLWDNIIQELDADFLLHAALGYHLEVYDASYSPPARAIWQGLEFIKFALNACWFDKLYKPEGKSRSSMKYFLTSYNCLQQRTKNKLKYFKKFLNTKEIYIRGFTGFTDHDGNYNYFAKIIRGYL